MIKIYLIFSLLILYSCGNQISDIKTKIKTSTSIQVHKETVEKNKAYSSEKDTNNSNPGSYSLASLTAFLDSISNTDPSCLVKKVEHYQDSLFKNQKELAVELSKADYDQLTEACRNGVMKISSVKRIFQDYKIDSAYNQKGELPIVYHSFDNDKFTFKYYAVIPETESGFKWDCRIYFFAKNKLIAEHYVFHRYGLDLRYFKTKSGNIIFYYKQNYGSGTGIWWYNYNFYVIDNDKVIPALNEIQEANLQSSRNIRSYYIKSVIEKENPLTIKFTYCNELSDIPHRQIKILDDSTTVCYSWNNLLKQFIPEYSKSELTKNMILSYFPGDNEVLFINSHYQLLKRLINGDDPLKKDLIFKYLNSVKGELQKKISR